MSLKCLFGHKWNGCKCEKCGKIRDEEHSFAPVDNKCIERCIRCGAEKYIKHVLMNNVCQRCGTKKDTLLQELKEEMHLCASKYSHYDIIYLLSNKYAALQCEDMFYDICKKYGEIFEFLLAPMQKLIFAKHNDKFIRPFPQDVSLYLCNEYLNKYASPKWKPLFWCPKPDDFKLKKNSDFHLISNEIVNNPSDYWKPSVYFGDKFFPNQDYDSFLKITEDCLRKENHQPLIDFQTNCAFDWVKSVMLNH